jgi:hypothetical protein
MKYNLVHNLLSIDTSEKYIPYFHYSPALDNLVKGKPKIELGYYVKEDLQKPKGLNKKFDFCWASKDSNTIYYEHPLIFGKKAKLLLDMTSDSYCLTVNRIYSKVVKFKFDNVWSPGQHFSNLLSIKLLQGKIITLHCASFSDKKTNNGYLIFGPSNTGKSYTTFEAIKKGFQYHSEDLTLLENGDIYTLPMISANSDKLPNKDLLLKIHLFFLSIPIINLIVPRFHTTKTFRKFAKKLDLNSKSKLNKIFILEKGKKRLCGLSKEEAFRKILILNRIELAYYKDHLFRSYSYFNKDLDIEKLYRLETELISKMVEESECYVVSSNSPEVYFPLIEDCLNKGVR